MWEINELVLFTGSLIIFVATIEVAYRFGVRYADSSNDSDRAHVNVLQNALLGLLALLFGFTFFMGASRFDQRKSLVLEEANAIGTTFLRSAFLPVEPQKATRQLLREYVATRLAFHGAGIDPNLLHRANSDAAEIERRLWTLTASVATEQANSIQTSLFIESLNEMFDIREKRQVALDNHVPEVVIYLLLVVSVISLALIGYGCGLARRRQSLLNILFTLIIVFVFTTIMDIDRPRRGFITVPQDSLIRVQASMGRDGS